MANALNSTPYMEPSFGLYVCFMGVFSCLEKAEVNGFSVNHDTGAPLMFMRHGAKKPRQRIFLSLPPILHIHGTVGLPKICKTVVHWVAINVVNLLGWHFSSLIQKRQTMSKVMPAINANVPIAHIVLASSGIAGLDGRTASHSPSKKSGIGVVLQKLKQSLARDHWLHSDKYSFWGGKS